MQNPVRVWQTPRPIQTPRKRRRMKLSAGCKSLNHQIGRSPALRYVKLSQRPELSGHQSVRDVRLSANSSKNGTSQSAVSSSLISVLKDELKYERENYRKAERLLEPPPNGFEVEAAVGKKAFYLFKELKNEMIAIEVDLDAQPGARDEDDEEDENEEGTIVEVSQAVTFIVTVTKESATLKFECEGDHDYVAINHIAHESHRPGNEDEDEEEGEAGDGKDSYTGPVFDELDDTLQQAFLDYLEERGISGELGGYLKSLCLDKAAQEYQAWLGRVKDFVVE